MQGVNWKKKGMGADIRVVQVEVEEVEEREGQAVAGCEWYLV